MNLIMTSNNQIVEKLTEQLTEEEKNAIVNESGRIIDAKYSNIESIIKKMMNLKPLDREVLDLVSQEYILRKVKNNIKSDNILKHIVHAKYNYMDENNKKAAEVLVESGSEAAVNHMVESAGGDYARMRAMYG